MKKVVIIGGGVAGLATAALLLREGHQVTIVERGSELGGRAGTLTVPEAPGFRWDTGPSWYLMPDAFEHFFELCGSSVAEHYELVTLEPAYRVIDEHGEAIDVHSGVAAVVELFESREPGAGAKVRRYLESSSEVYDLAIEGFLYTNFRNFLPYLAPGVLRRLPQLLASLATSLKVRVNAQFRDAKLRQILSYPAVFLSSDPGAIPALYHLMSHTDLVQGVQYPRGGFATVINALTTLADGAVIHLDSEVEEITVRDRKVTGVRVGERHIPADIVVSCADLHHTETRLLPEELRSRSEASWGRGEPGLGAVLVLAGVRGELPELLHHTLLFSSDWDDDFRKVFEGLPGGLPASESIYISRTSATDPDAAPEGHENLFILVPVPADPGIGHGDAYGAADGLVGEIADAAIAQIARWTGVGDLAERIVVKRTVGPGDFDTRYHAWNGGAIGPSHTLGQSAFFRGRNVSDKVGGLLYAGATTVPGVGVPMCLISAENVLKRLRGDNSVGPTQVQA